MTINEPIEAYQENDPDMLDGYEKVGVRKMKRITVLLLAALPLASGCVARFVSDYGVRAHLVDALSACELTNTVASVATPDRHMTCTTDAAGWIKIKPTYTYTILAPGTMVSMLPPSTRFSCSIAGFHQFTTNIVWDFTNERVFDMNEDTFVFDPVNMERRQPAPAR